MSLESSLPSLHFYGGLVIDSGLWKVQKREEEDGHCSRSGFPSISGDSGRLRPLNWCRRVLGVFWKFFTSQIGALQGQCCELRLDEGTRLRGRQLVLTSSQGR
ncbi:uncharacterized protein LOC133730094 [Rosa rugosa]|uniref:uncharacterized protein LOC133730094 n=1 Tax=Rosa rugosa TaxID=74645 RepID=UPI002B40D3F9|nr:uncharacterized protein LOC133730094 [Rosa rugosa]